MQLSPDSPPLAPYRITPGWGTGSARLRLPQTLPPRLHSAQTRPEANLLLEQDPFAPGS